MSSRFNSQSLILVGCTAFVLYLAGIPLVMLLYGSIRSAPIGEPGATYTIQNYVKAYFDKEFYLLLLNSVYYALGTCSLTFVIGTFLAWVSERTNTPLKKLFVVMSLIPFIIPGISEHDLVDSPPQPEDRLDQYCRQGGSRTRSGAVQRLFDVGHDLGGIDPSLSAGFSLDVGRFP